MELKSMDPVVIWLLSSVEKLKAISDARDMWKFVQFCKHMRLLCPQNVWNLQGTALLRGFQTLCGILEFTE